MRKINLVPAMLFFVAFTCLAISEKKITIIIPSWNNSKWYQKNLDMVLAQEYENFFVIYIDDYSNDGTADLVSACLVNHPRGNKVNLVRNSQRVGSLGNIYNVVNQLSDTDIVVMCDGDDWFAHAKVLNFINEIYQKNDVWITYGNYMSTSGGGSCCREVSSAIKKTGDFRKISWCFSHLKTFYAGLFKRINKEDLLYQGQFFPMAGDLAFMYPMLEMAGEHVRFIKDILYVYNVQTPYNDHKIDRKLQFNLERVIRQQKKHLPLNQLFAV